MAEPQNTSTRTRSHSGVEAGLPFSGRGVGPLGLAFGAALMLAACSGESDAASVPTVQLEPTTSTTVAPTTTSTEATTTTEDPAVAYERDVAEITAVYDQLRNFLRDHGVAPAHESLEMFSADPLLSTMRENLQSWDDQGLRLSAGAYDIIILDIELAETVAVLTSCNLDASSLLSADGAVVIPGDIERFLRTTEFVRTRTGWRASKTGYTNEEVTPCDG